MREALRLIADIASGSTTANSLPHIAKIAKEALAQPAVAEQHKQQPVAYRSYGVLKNGLEGWRFATDRSTFHDDPNQEALYTTPPQRKPLTVDDVWQNDQLMSLNAQLGCGMDLLMEVVEAIEAAHGIKE